MKKQYNVTPPPSARPEAFDFWPLIVVAAALLAGLSLFKPQLIITHETLSPLVRLDQLDKYLGDGQILVRWAPDLSRGYGNPLFNFYPPFFYFIAEMFVLADMGLISALNAAVVGLWVLSGLFMYRYARLFFKGRGAMVAAVAYVMAPYHIADVYVRGALAEFSSFALFPLCLWAFYKLTGERKFVYACAGAIAVAMMMMSHNIMAMIFMPVLAVYIATLAWSKSTKVQESKGQIWVSVGAMAVGLALSAFFWLPALVEKKFFSTAFLTTGYYNYASHFVYPDQLIYSRWGYGASVPGRADQMSLMAGWVHLFLAGLGLFILRRKETGPALRLHMVFFLVLLAASLFFTTALSAPLWRILPLMPFIQFPWRFLSLATLAVSFLCGAVVTRTRWTPWVAVGALILANVFYCQPRYTYTQVRDTRRLALARINDPRISSFAHYFSDYTPVWVSEAPDPGLTGQLIARNADLKVVSLRRLSAVHYVFSVDVPRDAQARFGQFYFPGWRVFVDGSEARIDPGVNGTIDFDVSRGVHEIRIVWTQTPVRRFAMVLSLAALFALLGGFLTAWIRR